MATGTDIRVRWKDWPFQQPEPLDRMLERAVRQCPAKVAVRHGDNELTYQQLYERSGNLARFFTETGDAPVVILLDNCVEFPVAYFGAIRAGRVVVPVNPLLKAPEVEYVIDDTSAEFAITTRAEMSKFAGLQQRHGNDRVLLVDEPDGPQSFARVVESETTHPVPSLPDESLSRPVAIMYTSGTTGRPKGAVLTHGSLMSVLISTNSLYGTTADDVFLCMLPMWHIYAATDCLLLPLWLGAEIVSTTGGEAEEILGLVGQRGVTCFASIPSVFAALADAPPLDLSHLKLCMSAGTALPGRVMEICEERYKVPIIEGYGLTEASATVTMNPVRGERRVGSVGTPIPGIEAEIADAADRRCPRTLLVRFGSVDRRSCLAITAGRRPRPRRFEMAGCTPAIWHVTTTKGICTLSIERRTCFRAKVITCIPVKWRKSSSASQGYVK